MRMMRDAYEAAVADYLEGHPDAPEDEVEASASAMAIMTMEKMLSQALQRVTVKGTKA